MTDRPTGIILAAGRGSRLGDLTDERPKCLVELAGRPLLAWQIGAMREAGVDEVVVVTGYRAELIERLGVRTVHAGRWAETNMVATLLEAFAAVPPPYVVSYSDIVYPPDHVRRVIDGVGDLRITYDTEWRSLWEARFENPLDDAETFRIRDGLVSEIGGTATRLDEIEGQFMGLFFISEIGRRWIIEMVDQHPNSDRLDSTTLLQSLIAAGRPLTGIPVDGQWAEIDDEHDLEVATTLHGSGRLRLAEVAPW